jgi:nicotinamidase-related amidase
MTDILLVVDVQNGFLKNGSDRVIPLVNELAEAFSGAGLPIVATRFINRPGSPYVEWIHWTRLMQPPDTDPPASLTARFDYVLIKDTYSAFSAEGVSYFESKGVTRIFICGIATDGCVLKTAVDAFERGIRPIVIRDACASHAGENVHQAGLLLISRFIGSDQIVDSSFVLSGIRGPLTPPASM